MPYSVKITVGRARTALLRLSLAVEAPENSAMCLARGPANSVISAGSWGRHRGCQAVESRVSCCRCPVWARAFRDRPPGGGGGHSTPSERASLSPSGSVRCPMVVPSGAFAPERGEGCIGAQSAARSGDGGAVRAGGVAGPGGACAPATLEAAVNTHESKNARFIPMEGKRPALAEVPQDANGAGAYPPGLPKKE